MKSPFPKMKMMMMMTIAAALAAGAAQAQTAPDPAAISQALREFLGRHGQVCVGKTDWPIDVSSRDRAMRTRNALQLPAMADAGLVSAREGVVIYRTDDVEEPVPTTRYELTELGRRYYRADRGVGGVGGGDAEMANRKADLCAGQVELDSIVRIEARASEAGQPPKASAEYLYRFMPQPWVESAAIRAVFPTVDTLIREQGRLHMTQGFHFDGERWVADTKLD